MARYLDRLKKGTPGTMEAYRDNIVTFNRLVRDSKELTDKERLLKLKELNSMLETLYGMQEKMEKKIFIKEDPDKGEDEEETVEITKTGDVVITRPAPVELKDDPESLVNSPEFGKHLAGAPVPQVNVEKKPSKVLDAIDAFFAERG